MKTSTYFKRLTVTLLIAALMLSASGCSYHIQKLPTDTETQSAAPEPTDAEDGTEVSSPEAAGQVGTEPDDADSGKKVPVATETEERAQMILNTETGFDDELLSEAVALAVPFLVSYDYTSGNETEDKLTHKLIKEIFRHELKNFDEIEEAFKESYVEFENYIYSNMISELIVRFRNISSIIDCVTCSKCRMHAKLEVFGIATMLKIMFAKSPDDLKQSMSRNELVSFINLFAKLSKAVNDVEMVNKRIKAAQHELTLKKFRCVFFIGIAGVIITLMILNFANAEEEKETTNEKNNDKGFNKKKIREDKKEIKNQKNKKD